MAWLFMLAVVADRSHEIFFGHDTQSFAARAEIWAWVTGQFMVTLLCGLTAVSDPSSKFVRWTLMANQTRAIAIMAVVLTDDLHLMSVLFRGIY